MNTRNYSLLAATLALFPISRLHELTGIGRSVGDMATDAPVLATPAPYTFMIWILIFGLWVVWAFRQTRPELAEPNHARHVAPPLLAAALAGNFWMLWATLYGNGPMLMALILLMAGFVFVAMGRLVKLLAPLAPARRDAFLLLPLGISICAGWLTLATLLNITGVMQMVANIPTNTTAASIALILAALVIVVGVFQSLRKTPVMALGYGLAVVWGLLGAVISNATPVHSAIGMASPPVAITALLGAVVVWALLIWQQQRAPQ